jgi:prepilin-type N-terminal cleavage/methylation domain-containing protein
MGKKSRGFSLIEVLVSLGLLTIGLLIVGTLAQQLARLSNKAKTTGVSIDFKSAAFAIQRDPAQWLDKMRGKYAPYETCLSIKGDNLAVDGCPTAYAPDKLTDMADDQVTADILQDDKLKDLSKGLFLARAPIYDSRGNLLAGGSLSDKSSGHVNSARYLNYDGSDCTKTSAECPLMSIGFFGRTNKDNTGAPGYARFIAMMTKNPNNKLQSNIPMAAQFSYVDIPDSGSATSGFCDKDTQVWAGTKTDGTPWCVSKTKSCDPGSIAVGIDDKGPICVVPPACPADQKAVLGPNNTIVCAPYSNCDKGYVELGNQPGHPICLSIANGCTDGQVQMGLIDKGNGVYAPDCQPIPLCGKGETPVYEHNKFTCEPDQKVTASDQCMKKDEFVVHVDKLTGNVECKPFSGVTNGTDGEDGKDGTTTGSGADGTDGTDGSDGSDANALKLLGPHSLPGLADGATDTGFEKQKSIWPMACLTTSGRSLSCGYIAGRHSIAPDADKDTYLHGLGVDDAARSGEVATSRRCMYIGGMWRRYNVVPATKTVAQRYQYKGTCSAGIMYKDMTPAAATLETTSVGYPVDPAPVSTPVSLNDNISANAKAYPTSAELLSYLNSCTDLDVALTISGTTNHCKAAQDAKRKALNFKNAYLEYDATTKTNKYEEQFCQVNVNGINSWAACGTGCGVVPKLKVLTKSGSRVKSYTFIYKLVRNYNQSDDDGEFLPTGNVCNGTSPETGRDAAKAYKNKMRIAPGIPYDQEDLATGDD